LIWRSRVTNLFSGFYMAVADGFVRQGPWYILWYGEGLEDRIFSLAQKLGAKPPDFEGDDGEILFCWLGRRARSCGPGDDGAD
ncbi:MAG: hypothetical protein AAF199_09105, partial [Pseudomonadota bacterium]